MWVEFIGFLAAFLSTAAFVPQAYKIYKENGQGSFANHVFGHVVWGVVLGGLWFNDWQMARHFGKFDLGINFALYHLR